MSFVAIMPHDCESLPAVRPENVAAWRDEMRQRRARNAIIWTKMTVLCSLFSHLWIAIAQIDDDCERALFGPVARPRANGYDGFTRRHLTTRAVEDLVRKYTNQIGLDPAVAVHSLRVAALTTARDRGRTLLTYKTSRAMQIREPH